MQTADQLSVENFDGENVDELIKIRQYFSPSKFCAIRYLYFISKMVLSYLFFSADPFNFSLSDRYALINMIIFA